MEEPSAASEAAEGYDPARASRASHIDRLHGPIIQWSFYNQHQLSSRFPWEPKRAGRPAYPSISALGHFRPICAGRIRSVSLTVSRHH